MVLVASWVTIATGLPTLAHGATAQDRAATQVGPAASGPVTAKASGLSLTLRPAIKGERVVATGGQSVGVVRTVLVQRKIGQRWSTVAVTRSGSSGQWAATSRAPAVAGSYRALAPAARALGVRFPQVTSPTRVLRFVTQRIAISAPVRAATTRSFRVSATASPARAGRPLLLQSRRGSGPWRLVKSGRQTGNGRTEWLLSEPRAGKVSYRALVGAHAGAAPVASPPRVVDLVPPPPTIVTSSLSAGRLEAAYHLVLRTAATVPGSWSVAAGALPDGIELHPASGTLAGVPAEAGTFSPAVTFTDAWGQKASTTYALDVYPRALGATSLVSSPSVGAPDESSKPLAISPDASEVVYASRARNLVSPATSSRLFSYDTGAGTTTPKAHTDSVCDTHNLALFYTASRDARHVLCIRPQSGTTPRFYAVDTQTGDSDFMSAIRMPTTGSVSADGTKVAFADSSGSIQVWTPGEGLIGLGVAGGSVTISPDGRFVAFKSTSTNVVPGVSPTGAQVYLRDLATDTTRLVSHVADGTDPSPTEVPLVGNDDQIAFSGDSRYLVYDSYGTGIAPGVDDPDDDSDVFRYDLTTEDNVLVSRALDGSAAGGSGVSASADGSVVAFTSRATDLVPGSWEGGGVYLADLDAGTVDLVSQAPDGRPAAGYWPVVSDDGDAVAFASVAGDLDAVRPGSRTGYTTNVYLWRRHPLDPGTGPGTR